MDWEKLVEYAQSIAELARHQDRTDLEYIQGDVDAIQALLNNAEDDEE